MCKMTLKSESLRGIVGGITVTVCPNTGGTATECASRVSANGTCEDKMLVEQLVIEAAKVFDDTGDFDINTAGNVACT